MSDWDVKLIIEGDFPNDLGEVGQSIVNDLCAPSLAEGASLEEIRQGLAGIAVACINEATRIREFLANGGEREE